VVDVTSALVDRLPLDIEAGIDFGNQEADLWEGVNLA
jgi:hypothetical protein